MIIVTGGAGFIGSNLVKELNRRSISNIIIVDDVNSNNEHNIKDLQFIEVISIDDFYSTFNKWHSVDTVFHEGAISSTTETDQNRIDRYNLQPSYWLIDKAEQYKFRLSYASSASVYGDSLTFSETQPLNPLSMYAVSKMRIDQYAYSTILDNPSCVIQGWRYFNVYGNNETHKKDQASPVSKFCSQATTTGEIKVFTGSENFLRDFICVDDIVKIKLSALEQNVSGVFNLGTGKARSFLSIAEAVSQKYSSKIVEIDFPKQLLAQYQKYTCSNQDSLTRILGNYEFKTVETFLSEQ
jgi:ADP-L-glycero-D-manno-heptose 6-epimerase